MQSAPQALLSASRAASPYTPTGCHRTHTARLLDPQCRACGPSQRCSEARSLLLGPWTLPDTAMCQRQQRGRSISLTWKCEEPGFCSWWKNAPCVDSCVSTGHVAPGWLQVRPGVCPCPALSTLSDVSRPSAQQETSSQKFYPEM